MATRRIASRARYGFSIIELLVVTGIILILASVVTPLLRSSTPTSNLTSSLTNLQQITLAEIVYQGDYNDDFVLSMSDGCNAGCPSTNPYVCISNASTPQPNWPILLEPYVGTLSTYVDPATGDPEGVFNPAGANYLASNWNSEAQYGYNYEFLSPISFVSRDGDIGNGTLCCGTATESGLGRSSISAVNLATSVMYTTSQSFATQWSLSISYLTPDSAFANAPGTYYALLPSQDRVFNVGSLCFGSSSPHNVTLFAALGYCGWAGSDPIGPLTADIRATFPYQGANVGWADGHATTETAAALAAGTDFSSATAASHPDPTYGLKTGCIVNGLAKSGNTQRKGATNAIGLAAPSGYLWSLDGTLSDLN